MSTFFPKFGATCLLLFLYYTGIQAQQQWITPFEKDNNASATYDQTISFYERLAEAYPLQFSLQQTGNTDAGFPLHLAIFSQNGHFSPDQARQENKLIVFINNAIHPGEPCGVDATMIFFKDLLQNNEQQNKLKDVIIVAIPFYNIGGGLNRGAYSRANQNGPKNHGFRGNAKNLDLNRDFIKADSKNAQTFNQIYGQWKPHIFVDNHTSNGADYQYVLTLIATQHNKLAPTMGKLLQKEMLPFLYAYMDGTPYEMIPYVNAFRTPDRGIAGFLDLPRYSSGYAALHNALSFMPETHMFKPFSDRVKSVYHFLQGVSTYAAQFKKSIQKARKEADEKVSQQMEFDLNWSLDRTAVDSLFFKGYKAKTKVSAVSGLERMYYDHEEPWEKNIPFYNTYTTTLKVEKPKAYILPYAYEDVANRLRWNGVNLYQLTADTHIEVETYTIEDFETRNAYEGHYLHYNIQVSRDTQKLLFRKGDYIIPTDQVANRYIIETLEPQAPDSWFAWNFFDGILQQKEYFSSYVFEDLAADFLEQNPALKDALEQKKTEDPEFAQSARAQLDFIYRNSPYYESTHKRYPVGRLLKNITLPMR